VQQVVFDADDVTVEVTASDDAAAAHGRTNGEAASTTGLHADSG
jgi:hypothetical protein